MFILWLLKTEGEIGRYHLARALGESQGVARGILARMKRRGLIIVQPRTAARVSRKGLRRLASLMKYHRLTRVERLDPTHLGLGPENVIFQVNRCSTLLGQGIVQRDAAIKAGATGAVTFLYDGKTLKFPGVAESVSRRSPTTFEQLRRRLKMMKGDVVLISFANTWWEAARGGFAAIRTLA